MLELAKSFAISVNQYVNPEAATFFMAMLPLIELRGAIPFAIGALELSPTNAYIWAVIGNIVPNFFILALLGPVSTFLRKHSKFFDKFFKKIFEKTRTKHTEKFDRYGALFLILFVAIPLPGSGSWTASLIAFLFGVSYWRAITLISIGIAISGLITTFAWEGLVSIFHAFS